ncbi:hypothetical protein V5O48_005244 [Marasmius crinis-equi]|uniref:Uncharacterized protein n=1 Tax=Marasmius crinis-equi TaxID=585013 RepID=A0ABR3FMT9_9AGAR
MGNPYRPNEDDASINLERFFLAGDFVAGVGYGIQLLLYYWCARFLWSRRKVSRQTKFLLVYITWLLIIETIFVVVEANTVQLLYVENRNYPGGPWAFFLASQYLPDDVLFYSTLFLLTFFADLLVLWRCWVIWRTSGTKIAILVTSIPGLIVAASVPLGILWTLQSSHPGLSMYSKLPLAFGTSYYAISLGVNIIITILITIRLLMYRRNAAGILPENHAREYLSLATIFVESAALYSVCSILFLITYAVNNPANQVLLSFASDAQQIAGYMIIYRVASGRAWTENTLKQGGPSLPVHGNRENEVSTKPMAFRQVRPGHDTTIITQLMTVDEGSRSSSSPGTGSQSDGEEQKQNDSPA